MNEVHIWYPKTKRNQVFKIGEMFKCYHTWRLDSGKAHFSDTEETPVKQSMKDWYLLLVMIWPTLLFICGFVGLFFSSIGLYQILIERDLNKRNEQQGIML